MNEHERDVLFSTGKGDHETPKWIIDWLDPVFHFKLDVCATAQNAKCTQYITPEMNAFRQNWGEMSDGGACWMNPPYGRDVGKWIAKADYEAMHGATVVALLPARTDTKWFHKYCKNGTIIFLEGRLQFVGTESAAPFPSMIVVFGPIEQEAFIHELGCQRLGEVWTR